MPVDQIVSSPSLKTSEDLETYNSCSGPVPQKRLSATTKPKVRTPRNNEQLKRSCSTSLVDNDEESAEATFVEIKYIFEGMDKSPRKRSFHHTCDKRAAREPDCTESSEFTDCEKKPRNVWSKWKNSQKQVSGASNKHDALSRQIRNIHNENRKGARIIKDCRMRLQDLRKKHELSPADLKELDDRSEILLREMERFDKSTKLIQSLINGEVNELMKKNEYEKKACEMLEFIPGDLSEPQISPELMQPYVLMEHSGPRAPVNQWMSRLSDGGETTRSKSEVELSRKLSESYMMQEKLVADNADLEGKRYVLYKELMSKDQNLELCRGQIKRLQRELKLVSNENLAMMKKLSRNNPEGDASSITKESLSYDPETTPDNINKAVDQLVSEELKEKLEKYNSLSSSLEKQVTEIEQEIKRLRSEMASEKSCKGGQGKNTCFEQPENCPPDPPMTKECGFCPPCPAPCNPEAPLTPTQKDVQKLTLQLRQTEDSFKSKVTECAMLRAEMYKQKEDLEKERCRHRDVQNNMRQLEMKFEGLTTHTNMLLGSKEQAFEQEVNMRALKQCYREAREEIEELRLLMKEQNEQVQDYRVKYLQAQQMVEEQKKQLDMMDMDNSRISEQINYEIQKVKLKFQEKLQELAPIPDLLKATQLKLKDAQQSQALAEHNAEMLARELTVAREKMHMMLHSAVKPPEKAAPSSGDENKQATMLQQRVTQLTEANAALKAEVERLRSNVIRMEETVLISEKRLQEKLHECAMLGGELDRSRDDAARALQRANERVETSKKCLQTTVAELERQLAASRAQVSHAGKEREEIQKRMNCQVQRLNENFEQAQLRVMTLTEQMRVLRAEGSDEEGEDSDNQECLCKTYFKDD